ncbi:MAG: cytochrome c family protein [Acidobacteriia bacterium]|nr:cytochrome c family protein [Terriglobia bacterium]
MHAIRPGNNSVIKLQIAQLCEKCHDKQFASYKTSVHARALERGDGEAATCTDCHGGHAIQGPESAGSPVAPASVSSTCGACHADKKTMSMSGLPTDRVSTFRSSFHAAALRMGNMKAATCASCHGAHDILASPDPASRTSPANLPKTCSRCHAGVKQGFAGVRIHVDVSPTGARAAWFVRIFYIAFISILVLGFIIHILAERLGALRKRRIAHRDASSEKGGVQ